ncbi:MULTISPECIES: RNA-binding protein [Methylobacterium]|uniref:YlxR domain-containing protein n=2 Tax=Pseudomonadota TaxID=1224 RepID=A0ABQ4SNI3_9HYPH|nr:MULTISPECIES: RNA-binding protein [Methylobacterium]PIU06824.1 MAG: DNA-binding protein [Methylobacterium sp. CG09_land_8_20_14_0_10_71_15]PIU13398.1 MAG: DNA-binding protein [Methylobacterium sp. CG08_land_8_20_14_0_20_71_15]GBU18502.1 DNA-binding protein [Methylobacterium sp.]GJE04784.1 hypothetical protein AOPFMNJM_0076 [Methylobacterium jeotgali]
MSGAAETVEADGLDSGPARGRHTPARTCIVTRAVRPPEEMIRFVLSPSGEVVADLKGRLPGRGAWVSARRTAVAEAVRRRQFQRAFRTAEARAPAELPDGIAAALRADLRQSLALANKAGCVVAGFAKVEAAIGEPAGISGLIHARDGSQDGLRKLRAALYRRLGDAISRVPVLDDLSNEELDMALGRDHVIHAALVAGVGSAGCLARWRRLRLFEDAVDTTEAGSADHGEAGSAPHDETGFSTGAPQVAGSRDDGTPQGSG